jgi:hemin uptake protein HemP
MRTRHLNNLAISVVSPTPPASPSPIVVSSADIFLGAQELHIRHNGEVYRLVVTKDGELILNK